MTRPSRLPGRSRQRLGLGLGPGLFVAVLLGAPFDIPGAANAALACTLWIAAWWVTEAIPIPATSLLPIVLFPVTGVVDVGGATTPYADPVVFLLLGGFLLALAIERWDLHRRIALGIVGVVGVQADRLLLGFMLATAVLSMWISNSAAAMLMVPIGTAVIVAIASLDDAPTSPTAPTSQTPDESAPTSQPQREGAATARPGHATTDEDTVEPVDDLDLVTDVATEPVDRPGSDLGLALLLGIAYSASIGGMATLIGSPPNAVFAGVADTRLDVQISFVDWLVFAGPLAVVFLLVTWQLLVRLLQPSIADPDAVKRVLDAERDALGEMHTGERRVLAVFVLVAGGWLLRPFVLQPLVPAVTDTSIAMIGGVLLFVVPVDLADREFLLDWRDTDRLPWGVLLLLGAGFSLANAFQASGLDRVIAHGLATTAGIPLLALVLVLATVVVFLTEVTSNTATATVFMPVMISLALTLQLDPLTLMATVALAASMAFMLPVATPPNAVVFGSGYVTIPQMSRVGLWLNLLAIVAIAALTYAWLPIALAAAG